MRRWVFAVVVGSITLGTAGPAEAAGLRCGDTITTDVVLAADLSCKGTALTVGIGAGKRIRLDLAGHTIRGNGTGVGVAAWSDGSRGDGSGLDISGGTIRGFASALLSEEHTTHGPQNLTLGSVKLSKNGQWTSLGVSETLRVTSSTFSDTGLGGAGVDGQLTVVQSTFTRSGLHSAGQTNNAVYASTFTGGGISAGVTSGVIAVGNTIKSCDPASSVGVNIVQGAGRVAGNRISGCQVGVQVLDPESAVMVDGNTVAGGGTGVRYSAGLPYAIKVTGNVISGGSANGIEGDGKGPVTIGSNIVTGMGWHGIDVDGAIDGGGNMASGNGEEPQCVGVVCGP